ncbi:MAG: undecaprenyl diphosphate synthase family protein [Candidatus Nanohaloarchaea archaeon]
MHLGVIPDGNRRYARNHSMPKFKAYRKAKDVIADVSDHLDEFPMDVEEATFYLLSEKNLERDEDELETLYKLLEENMEEIAERFNQEDFRFNWASTRPDAIPEKLRERLRELEKRFDEGEKRLNALIAYDGKRDITRAAEKLKEAGKEVTDQNLARHLEVDTDIDYVIRTGDNPTRECLSGFPIWNSSYAEYYHLKKNFPAVTPEDVRESLEHFQKLRRKKGR